MQRTVISILSFALSLQAQSPATLTIDPATPIHKVSPTLYGLMTEEINYSYDGGLYAELVRNRTFQDHSWEGIAAWLPVELGSSEASITVDTTDGPSPALPKSLKLEVKHADPASPAGLRNEGYWGIAVRPDTTYQGSFYAKADAASIGPITVSLINDTSGKPLATAALNALTTDWAQYQFTLKTASNIEPSAANHLQLTVTHPGTLRLSLVSLFPPTYKNRANGNRSDIMEKLAAMHPKFLRLPGGNYLEGDTIEDRFDWKTTIGPLVDRPTHRSPWSYQSSDGLGFLEFLEWCEDLEIQPVLAVYAGYSLKGAHINPGPALTPYVSDALEEIEFVTGDTSTKWGAIRAKYGHPAPFPLSYVEVGNEDNFDRSGSYEGRFAQFYKAIKAKYPQLQIIATMPLKRMKPDVLDDHYYRSADEMFANAKQYDTVDRNGPKIFIGEWATREGSPTTNMGAALGDAAWMTGLERNSDLIVMSCYAPLFVNVNPGGMQWRSDLIGYDALNSYGSPAYYAQILFANHLGTDVLKSSLEGAGQRFFHSVTSDRGTIFIKLVNASSNPQEVQIKLAGSTLVATNYSIETLSGNDTTETNSITSPQRIVPVKATAQGASSSFVHTVPGYAIQVLELKLRP